ncbi:hypothetical protein N7510_003262 [Penicillium lagena]|uniref:uncharacterized protein n=1 Tax=Penicillium lagena TaxID=94218 RepID=UPI0025401D24|nr:uncharacterized protein N7510_003262 [Penicillium lagena]KAJ5619278.1 hypothetical protein N7510_003262 [Penicillium lagena]
MPPRIQSRRVSNTLLPYLSSSSSSPASHSSLLTSRQFSSTPAQQTKLRREMFAWLNTTGATLKHHVPGETNYVTGVVRNVMSDGGSKLPFPNNPSFFSEPVLSEELRNEIYARVTKQQKSIRAVSVDMGIDMNRVAAVVRLVELEKRQRAQGKPLALPYARAIHEMVPVTPLSQDGERQTYHEPINDLPTHPSTGAQIFYPVPESRKFTRVDAGRVFSGAPAMDHETAAKISHPSDLAEGIMEKPNSIEWVGKGDNARQVLQPADVRIPHPQLVNFEIDRINEPLARRERAERQAQRIKKQDELEQKRRERAQARRQDRIAKVEPADSRFEYRFHDTVVSKETTGPHGKGHLAPGRRYGVPSEDRKRGIVKIPTRVGA